MPAQEASTWSRWPSSVPALGVVVSAPLVLGGLLVGGLGFGAALGSAR